MKMNLNNYLTLNNERNILSFTFLRIFEYRTHNMIEYLVHSISFVFMIFQAIYL